jgi:hypothetical protein
MSQGARLHGWRPLVYIGATELVSARGYTLTIAGDVAVDSAFGELWKTATGGPLGASGNIDALLEHDQKILFTAATNTSRATTHVMIYPNRADIADVLSFDALFGTSFSGDVGSMQKNPGDFTVNGAVAVSGFS